MKLIQSCLMVAASMTLAACNSGGGEEAPKASSPNSKKPAAPISSEDATTPGGSGDPASSGGNGTEKCWAKLLDTPELKACNSSGKIYNRIQAKCVDAGIQLKPGCSNADVPAADLKRAQDTIIAKLGAESAPQVDQCGTYTVGAKSYQVVYVIGKKYTGAPSGVGSYQYESRLLCYQPAGGTSAVCGNPDLSLSSQIATAPEISCN